MPNRGKVLLTKRDAERIGLAALLWITGIVGAILGLTISLREPRQRAGMDA
jgi:hypothetical protein